MRSHQIFIFTFSIIFSCISVFPQDPVSLPAAYDPASLKINYIRSWDANVPETNPNALIARPLKDVKQTTQYLDGLGRPLQTVVKSGSLITDPANPASSANARDMISAIVYDEFGREPYRYLPFASTSTDATKNDGLFKLNPFPQQASFYNTQLNSQVGETNVGINGTNWAYSQVFYEPSPLNRVTEVFAPGAKWVGTSAQALESNRRSVKTRYYTNTETDGVRIWNITDGAIGAFGTYGSPGAYAAGQLYKTITVDEHGKQVIEFRDKEDKIVLKKVQLSSTGDDGSGSGHSGWLCTYYMYDDLNNLRCVLQPRGVELISANWVLTNTGHLSQQCFRYAYDSRNRMISKQVPGSGTVYMVYDQRDRLVMTQDAVMRAATQWMVTKYDDLNRPVETGLWTNPAAVATHWSAASQAESYPPTTGTYTELTKTFYDNYDWLAANGNPFSKDRSTEHDPQFLAPSNTVYPYPQPLTQSFSTTGLVTGTRTRVLGTGQNLWSINYYDNKGRVIQSMSYNITGWATTVQTQYDFAGKVLRQSVGSPKNFATTPRNDYMVTIFEYDDLGRLLNTKKKTYSYTNSTWYGGEEKQLLRNEYDALSQLKNKKIGNKPGEAPGTPLVKLDYDYNIRGWLLSVNKDYIQSSVNNDRYFGMELGYEKNGSLGTFSPQYNGNISGAIWKSAGDQEKRKYDFTYDAVNRLKTADFNQYVSGTGTAAIFDKSAKVDFSVSGLNYDANGNILNMTQKGLKLGGSVTVDQLSYGYQSYSNRIKTVSESGAIGMTDHKLGDFTDRNRTGDDYIYDANGNLTIDKNKSISSITYNHLNLPSVITITGKGTITYTYDAAGNKLKKVTQESNASVPYNGASHTTDITTTTFYIDGAVYESKEYTAAALDPLEYRDRLQFIGHEEGRARWKEETSSFHYDYFLKDHLGNVRMVLTEEQKQDKYPVASLEDPKLVTEEDYYAIDPSKIVLATSVTGLPAYTNDNGIGNTPSDPSFEAANSQKLYKLNSNVNKTGLGITVKVMSGDRIDIHGKSYYFQNNTGGSSVNSAVPVLEILEGLLGGPTGGVASGVHGGVTPTQLNGYPATTNGINELLSDQTLESSQAVYVPKAYINYLFFDEQFKCVGSGFSKVGVNSQIKDHFSELQNLTAPKNGYVYIYCSNESPVNVFFDNLQVVHTRSPMLEETHYYPFGLTMSGISSKILAFGNPENKKKFNGIEQNSDFDLNMYDAFYRNLDPQTGRFWQIDPKPTDEISLYAAMNNNPIKYSDPLGDTLRFPGATESFRENFELASNHLIKKGVGSFIKKAQRMKGDLNIVETDEGTSYYDMGTNTIYWDPLAAGVFTNDDDNSQVIISPAAVLNHELDHGVEHVMNPTKVEKLKATKDKEYGNKEERRVITGSEQKTARALGHSKKSQVTRKSHDGGTRRVSSPLSTDDVVGDKIKELLDQMHKKKQK